ncbi:MAG: maleylpyruvate isomerase family mycothiol-dependent enzyme [Dehalococcoidia bacterium]|nr:maleylpyruvate isomerase family mycothiol-dependent enzyme [Dehalococcoidia bacterium]
MDTPEIRLKVLEAETCAANEYFASLSSEELQMPSACVDWSVADVMGHLAGQDHASRVRRGLQGDYSPPDSAPPVADFDEDQFAKNISERALATREHQGEGLVAYLNQRLAETVEVFNSAGPNDWDMLCYWPPGPEAVRTLLDQRIAELTMHTWDIRSVLDDEFHLSDDAVEVLIDGVDRAARRAFRPDPSLLQPVTHRFVIEGPAADRWDIVISAGGAEVGPAGSEEPDVTFQCDGETYVLVMYGRLKAMDELAEGRLTFDGNPALAAGFGRRFVGG